MMGIANLLNIQMQQSRSQHDREIQQSQLQHDREIQQQLDRNIREKNVAASLLAQQKADRDFAARKSLKNNQINEEKNIDIILKTAKDASEKGDYKQTIQITTSLISNYPNLEPFSNAAYAYIYRAKALAAIGKKDLAIADIKKYAVITRSLGNQEIDPLLTKAISNLNLCGSTQCDRNASIKPQQLPVPTVRSADAPSTIVHDRHLAHPVVPDRPVGVAAIEVHLAHPVVPDRPVGVAATVPSVAKTPAEIPKRPAPSIPISPAK